MKSQDKDAKTSLSRRALLRGAGVAGAVAGSLGGQAQAAAPSPPRREALEALTAIEADVLEAFCARLIPSDAAGPGAKEARAAHYIDRALAGALASSREPYRSGLGALNARAQAAHGAPFAQLSPDLQDALLTETEAKDGAFFALVRGHTLQGMFGDPYYGGNADFIGWDMIGYPGLRLMASAEQQAMDPHLKPTHESAYDFAMFNRSHGAHHDMADMPHQTPGAGRKDP
ncbi:MAG TPA: gluconate 2-dehydrogenase subunit 3 family protein [Caulobacteraceae bacterium]|nr:gluconate 2-dehydrogenase subunit 3 family protein [Caulobacteraceae bacterium]